MKLQTRVMLILAVVWVITSVIVYAESKIILEKNFETLERTLIENEMHDAERAFDRMISSLSLYTLAWAQWDEAYDFMKTKNQRFIRSNFVPGTFTSSKINFFLLFNNQGNLYYGKEYDLKHDRFVDISSDLLNYITQHSDIVKYNSTTSKKAGVINTEAGLIVIASLPIVTGDGKGPIRGGLIMGYYLTDEQFKSLSDTVGISLRFYPLPIATQNTAALTAYEQLSMGKKEYINILDSRTAYGYTLLYSINNEPIGVLQMEIPRAANIQAETLIHHYQLIIIILGVVIMLLMWYSIKRFILNRIINVSNELADINKKNNFDHTIENTGSDEISSLITSINNMMELISVSQKRLEYQASHDALTTLPNREAFYSALSKALYEAKTNSTRVAVLFMDMDKFKSINDKFGHDMGDSLLIIIALRLKKIIKDTDMVCRQSGDEFIIFLRDIKSIDDVSNAAERILQESSKTYNMDGVIINGTFSIGISIYPDDGKNIEELISAADAAMYEAKKRSGNQYRYYSTTFEQEKTKN